MNTSAILAVLFLAQSILSLIVLYWLGEARRDLSAAEVKVRNAREALRAASTDLAATEAAHTSANTCALKLLDHLNTEHGCDYTASLACLICGQRFEARNRHDMASWQRDHLCGSPVTIPSHLENQ